jgi:hypothetical protein
MLGNLFYAPLTLEKFLCMGKLLDGPKQPTVCFVFTLSSLSHALGIFVNHYPAAQLFNTIRRTYF